MSLFNLFKKKRILSDKDKSALFLINSEIDNMCILKAKSVIDFLKKLKNSIIYEKDCLDTINEKLILAKKNNTGEAIKYIKMLKYAFEKERIFLEKLKEKKNE